MTDWKKEAEKLDSKDPLSLYRKRFRKDDNNLVYLDGNSLGMLPLETEQLMKRVVSQEWGNSLINGWNSGWWTMPSETGKMISSIIGAGSDEVIVCDSTSINLYKLLFAALKLRPGRKKVVSDRLNFPSDLYIMQGVISNIDQGHSLELAESGNGIDISTGELESLIDSSTAVVVLTHVNYRSGFMYDMKEISALAHSKGALVIWDLCHSVGAVEVDLGDASADMAVGCTYKYLNGGPGSPAFLYVKKELQGEIVSPVWGWLGEKDPFEFSTQYRPATGIRQYLTGTPGILSLSAVQPALRITIEAGMNQIRRKSVIMTSFLYTMASELLFPLGFMIGSPADPSKRGSHISLRHPEGYRICRALTDPANGEYRIIPDFRPPDNIRMGLAPLYNSFLDIYIAVMETARIVSEKDYEKYSPEPEGVT